MTAERNETGVLPLILSRSGAVGALFYVVAILGCGDGADACTDARLLPAHYATVAQCRAALPTALAANTDVPFPEIGADCRPQGLRVARTEQTPRRGG